MKQFSATAVYKQSFTIFKAHWMPLIGFIVLYWVMSVLPGVAQGDGIIGSLVYILGILICFGIMTAINKFVLDISYGKQTTMKDAFEFLTVPLVARVILGMIIVGIIRVLSFILLVIPFIFISPRLQFVTQYILQGNGVRESIKKSYAVTKGHIGFIWKVYIMSAIVSFVGILCLIIGIFPAFAIILIMSSVTFKQLADLQPQATTQELQ